MVANEQGAEIFASAFGERVAADDKLLLLGEFDFDPATVRSAKLVFTRVCQSSVTKGNTETVLAPRGRRTPWRR